MMKRKWLSLIAFAFVLLFVTVACLDTEYTPGFELSETKFWLDRYEEKAVELKSGDLNSLEFVSGNESVVTVEKGKLIARGEGTAKVNISDGNSSVSIEVRVNDSGVKPKIGFKEFNAYCNKSVAIPSYVDYKGEMMETHIDYSLAVEDNSYLKIEGNNVTGLKEGCVRGTLTAEWKGLSLRQDVTINIKPPVYIEAEKDITLHNVKSEPGHSSLNARALNAKVYNLGELVENAPITYGIESGENCVEVKEGVVCAVNEGRAVIVASYTSGETAASCKINVEVLPNYVETYFEKANNAFDITYEQCTEEIGGRTADNMYEYRAAQGVTGDTCWSQRVVNPENTKNIIDLYRKGYRYFTYDLYYTSNENLMVGCYNLTSWLSVGSYMRRDYLMITEDGRAVNRLEKNQWIKMIYDLKAIWSDSTSYPTSFFFFVNDDSTSQYIMNVRWYLDDSVVPDENLVYEDRGDYYQATNDEFDIDTPVSRGYYKGSDKPSVKVKPEDVPLYGKYESEIAGRPDVYKYETRIPGSAINRLDVAKSVNGTYDEGMYAMSKLGTHFVFDIYPEAGNVLTFTINGDTTAAVELNKTNLGRYEKWLIIIKDNKRQNVIAPDSWQTVVIAYGDNYKEGCQSSVIGFSANERDSIVYIDNVRYYKNGDFIPEEYEEENICPYLPANAEGSFERIMDGEFRQSYRYRPAGGDIANAVRFKTVSENGVAGQFFKDGKRFVKFGFFAESNISSVIAGSRGTGNITEYFAEIPIGRTLDKEAEIYVVNEDGTNTDMLQEGSWYTICLPVKYTSPEIDDCDVYVYTVAKDGDVPMSSYIKSLDFIYDINGLYTRDYFNYAGLVNVEFVKEGNMKGSWKYTNASSGDLDTDPLDNIDSKNWGESGVAFDNVTKRNDDGAGAFFMNGYKAVKCDFLVGENTKSVSIRVSGQREVGTVTEYWVRDIKTDSYINDPSKVYIVNAQGDRAVAIIRNEWYTLYIPVEYSSADIGTYGIVSVQSNGGSKALPSVMYFKDVEYLEEMPLLPEPVMPPIEIAKWDYEGAYGVHNDVEKLIDGRILYRNHFSSSLGSNFVSSGIYFKNMYNDRGGYAADAPFFANGFTCVKTDIMLSDNVTALYLQFGADENTFIENIRIGEALPANVYLYDRDGDEKAETLERDVWYTLYINVDVEVNNNEWYTLTTDGGTTDVPAIAYFERIEYLESNPKVIPGSDLQPGTRIEVGTWDTKSEVTLETQADGTVIYTNIAIADQEGVEGMDYGESGFYFKEYYDNKSTDAFADYKFIAMRFRLIENVTEFTMRISDSSYAVRHVKVGEAFADNVYLYNPDGTKPATLESDTEYIIYIPVAPADNWDSFQITGGSAEAPAKMAILSVEYKETNPHIRPDYLYVCEASGSDYPEQLGFIERLPDGNLLYTNKSAGDPDNTADNGWSGLYVIGGHRIAGSYEKMEIKIGRNTKSVSINNEADLKEIAVGAKAETFPERFYLYNMDGTKAGSFERDVWYVLYLPIGGWNEIMINGGSHENPAEMLVGDVENVSALPQ